MLVGILSLVVIVNVWSSISSILFRLFKPRRRHLLLDLEVKGAAPDGYGSVAWMGALLLGSGYDDHLPADAHSMQPERLLQFLGERTFEKEWFDDRRRGGKCYTIDVVGEEEDSERGLVNDEENTERTSPADGLLR